jgi:hypothetical protein
VDAKAAARVLAWGRVVTGAALVLTPRLVGAAWLGRDGTTPGSTVLARATGARDVLLGFMLLHTADHPQVAARWLRACAAVDAVDGAAAFAQRDHLPLRGGLGTALAATASVSGFVLAAQQREAQADSPR